MTQDEIIAAIRDMIADDAGKAREFAKALHTDIHAVGQAIIDTNAGRIKREAQNELKARESEVAALKEQLDARGEEITELQKKQPDYEARERTLKDKLAKQVEAKDAEISRLAGEVKTRDRGTWVRVAEDHLKFGQPGGVDADYGREVVRARLERAIDVAEGTPKFLDPATNSEIVPGDGRPETAAKLLAEATLKTVDAKWRLASGQDKGGGTSAAVGGSSGVSQGAAVDAAIAAKKRTGAYQRF